MNPPKIALLIFGAGTMVCTGARTIHQAIYIINKVIDKLKDAGYVDAKFVPLTTENMVASVRTPWRFDLSALHEAYTEYCDYEPELFPGVTVHHPALNKVAILVFKSGKMVVTGARVKRNIYDALDTCMPFIMENRSDPNEPRGTKRAAAVATTTRKRSKKTL